MRSHEQSQLSVEAPVRLEEVDSDVGMRGEVFGSPSAVVCTDLEEQPAWSRGARHHVATESAESGVTATDACTECQVEGALPTHATPSYTLVHPDHDPLWQNKLYYT